MELEKSFYACVDGFGYTPWSGEKGGRSSRFDREYSWIERLRSKGHFDKQIIVYFF